jgi:hypothetical protein
VHTNNSESEKLCLQIEPTKWRFYYKLYGFSDKKKPWGWLCMEPKHMSGLIEMF